MTTICLRWFDSKRCMFEWNKKKTKEEAIKTCQNMRCPKGTIMEKTINGEKALIISCDYTWNPFDNREVTSEEYLEWMF